MVAFSSQYKINNPEKRVLVVEDNALYREYVKSALGLLSIPVTEAENGLCALEMNHLEDFDLIITDMMMPEMDGITLIEEVRKVRPDVKIIAMTAGGRNAERESYLELAEESGVDGLLRKPFPCGDLHTLVKDIFSIN